MRRYRGKRKNNIFLLVILVLCVTIGYAILSTSLNITGLAGINKNTWDIHWNRTSVNVSEGRWNLLLNLHYLEIFMNLL